MRSNYPWKGNCGPLLIAEIGGNHEGNFNKAKKLLDLAIDSGVDCVKFQLYTGNSLVNKKISPDRNKHFKKFELNRLQHEELAEHCIKNNVIYNASVWDLEMLNWIDKYLTFYKIGSGDLTAYPIICEFAKRGKPIILSTGLSNEDEVLDTINYIQSINSDYKKPDMLCVMQCTSMYPISDSYAHLSAIPRLKSITGLSVGYSDHTIGTDALKIASALGAEVLEFHFTDSRKDKVFRDHMVSLTKDESIFLSNEIEKISLLLGKPKKSLQSIEIDNNHHISFRRAIYLKKDIKKGELINLEDMAFLRPLKGTCSSDFKKVIGARAIKDIKAYEEIYNGVDFIQNR